MGVPHFTSQPFQGCRELSKHLVPNVAFGNVGLEARNRFAVHRLKPRSRIGSGLDLGHRQTFTRNFPTQNFGAFFSS